MWRVRLYVGIYKIFGKHPKIGRWAHNSYLFQKFMPVLAKFDSGFSDRRYMSEHILPALTKLPIQRVLFVGCRAYTARYRATLTRAGIDYWTTDIDPEAAVWGAGDQHIVSDITRIDDACDPEAFDAVLLNGVIGDGVDDEDAMNRAVTAIGRILKPGGILLIGWNSNKPHPDPMKLAAVNKYFCRQSILPLPLRKTFPDTDHVYDWLTKARAAQPVPDAAGF